MQYLDRGLHCQSGGSGSSWRQFLGKIVDAWLPQQCLLCGGPGRDASLCPPCRADLPRNEPACSSCGIPLAGLTTGVCGECQLRPCPWHAVHAPLAWQWPVDQLVKQLKYQRKLAVASGLARLMHERLIDDGPEAGAVLVPVPLHWRRLQRRGFNQSEQLGRALAHLTGMPLLGHALRRKRRTPTQTGLSAAERRRNLRHAFTWRGPSLQGVEVWLLDDVLTTGATAAACARVLKRAGASKVVVWVAARAA